MVDKVKDFLLAKDAPNWVPVLGWLVAGVLLIVWLSSGSEYLVPRKNEIVKYRTGRFLGTRGSGPKDGLVGSRGLGPNNWSTNVELSNYFAGANLSDDMSGVTDDAAAVASGPADQHASDMALKKNKEKMSNGLSTESRLQNIALLG